MRLAIRLAAAGTVLLVAALVAWATGGARQDAAENRRRIAEMTETEREAIRREWDAFQRMPESERESIRRLHEQVGQAPNLERKLLEYERFLGRLDALEREELRQMPDPTKRVARIEQLVAEHRPPRSPGRPPWLAGQFMAGSVLSPPDFDKALRIVAGALGPTPATDAQALAEPRHVRHLQILRQVAAKNPEGQPFAWPDDATVEKILDLYPDGWFKDRVLKADASKTNGSPKGKDASNAKADAPAPPRGEEHGGDRRRGNPRDFRRMVALGLLGRSLLAEWQWEAGKRLTSEQIRKAIDELTDNKILTESEQNEMARRRPDALFRKAITDVIAEQSDDDGQFSKEFAEVVKLRSRFDPFAFGDSGRHSGGPFPGGGPPDGPPDGGPSGRRGPGFGSPGDGSDRADRGPGRGGPDRRGPPDRDRGRD